MSAPASAAATTAAEVIDPTEFFNREPNRLLPVANVFRVMKECLQSNAKIAKDAKEIMQECVSEFIGFIASEYVGVSVQIREFL